MKKIIIAIIVMAAFFIMPNVYAEESYGTVTSLVGAANFNGTNSTANVEVTYETLNLNWSEAKEGRFKDGWWIGIKIQAPSTNFNADKAQVRRGTPDGTIKTVPFSQIKDGENYVNAWLYIDETVKDNELFGKYELDWNGDGVYEQTIQFKVNKAGMNLQKPEGLKTVTVKGANGISLVFPTKKNNLSEFTAGENLVLGQVKNIEGKKFIGFKTEAGKDFSETDEFTDGLVLIAQYEEIKAEEPAKKSEETTTTKNENNPDTADINLYLLITLLSVSGCGIVYTIKKRFN